MNWIGIRERVLERWPERAGRFVWGRAAPRRPPAACRVDHTAHDDMHQLEHEQPWRHRSCIAPPTATSGSCTGLVSCRSPAGISRRHQARRRPRGGRLSVLQRRHEHQTRALPFSSTAIRRNLVDARWHASASRSDCRLRAGVGRRSARCVHGRRSPHPARRVSQNQQSCLRGDLVAPRNTQSAPSREGWQPRQRLRRFHLPDRLFIGVFVFNVFVDSLARQILLQNVRKRRSHDYRDAAVTATGII